MMRPVDRFFILFLALALLSHTARPFAASAETFLWRVQSPGSTVYLLGSMHFARKDLYPLPAKMESAFAQADTLVVEAEIDRLDPEALQALTFKYAFAPPGRSLRDYLSEDLYHAAGQKLEAAGVDIAQFGRFKPWFLAMALTTLQLRRLGFDERYGLDRYFLDKARAGKKQVLALETADAQMTLLGEIDDDHQGAFLKYTLLNLETIESLMERMVLAWKAGDTGTLLTILRKSLAGDPALEKIYERFVDDRNRSMTEIIEEYLGADGRTYFIIVGAGHLVGKKGIVALLREKGYRADQM